MKFITTQLGGTKKVLEVGDRATYRNIFAPKYIAYGSEKKTGKILELSALLEEGSSYEIKEVIPANVHKPHDLHRYVLHVTKDGNICQFIVPEIYLG